MEKEETICELSVRVSPLVKQVRILAKLLAVHPNGMSILKYVQERCHGFNPTHLIRANLDAGRTISYGSEFLGYLYDEITDVVQPDVYALLVFILSQCCDVYFR